MKHAGIAELTTTELEKTFEEIMVAVGDSLRDFAHSDNWDDGEDDDDEETEHGKLSEDDKPCWVMGTITKMVQQCMDWFQKKEIKLDELTQLVLEDGADYFCERDKKYGTSELRVHAIVQPQTDDIAAALAPTTFGEHMESLVITPGISQMPQDTYRPGSSHIMLGSVKPQFNTCLSGL